MKYAREVIDLMAAYPGRRWRMYQIVSYVAGGKPPSTLHRNRFRQGVARVLSALVEAQVVTAEFAKRGQPGVYCWGRCEQKCDTDKSRAGLRSA